MKRVLFGMFCAVAIGGCFSSTIKVEPVRVEPIHMTVDVNLHDSNDPAPVASRR